MALPVELETPRVIFKEFRDKKEQFYAKPPENEEQINANVVKRSAKTAALSDSFKKIFLPQGYPHSVSKDYLAYQIWDTAQAFCSTIAGILSTQELLRGVGVGDSSATALAATTMWVVKDGCGHVGRILFAFTHGKLLDSYSKKWRLYADVLNNAAMCVEIALPHYKSYSMYALCISTGMKAIVGVAGGATRIAMTQHQAIKGNLGDVSAKDASQETAVNLLASVVALGIINYLGSRTTIVIFILMMILHVAFNYCAVRAVCLRTLNAPRFLLLIDKYIRRLSIAPPSVINKMEPIFTYKLGPFSLDRKICGFKIILGASLEDSMGDKLNIDKLMFLRDMYIKKPYVLVPNLERKTMHVILKQGVTPDNILCSYFHAVLLSFATCAINTGTSSVCPVQDPPPFALVCAALQEDNWGRPHPPEPGTRAAYVPSPDLLSYLNGIVAKEWLGLRDGLRQTGWDIVNNQLEVGPWRLDKGTPDELASDLPDDADQQFYRRVEMENLRRRLNAFTPQTLM